MTDSLRLIAPLHHRSGYAKAGRGLLAAALRAGLNVEAIESERKIETTLFVDGRVERRSLPMFRTPLPEVQAQELRQGLQTQVAPDAPTLILGNPSALSEWSEFSAGHRIGFTMWEADTIAPGWARSCENVDTLLVPSRWNLEAAERQVRRPCKQLFPLCVDARCWSPEGERREVAQRPEFLFVSVFSTCERKGWRTLMQAFAEEFRGESVGLLVLPSRANEALELAGWCRAMGAWVEVVEERLSERQMGAFYRAADAYVLPSAEGFGLPFVEAAMCGIPSIGLDGGGAQDPLTLLGGFRVPCKPTPCVGLLPQVYRSDYRWLSCEIGALRKTLRRAYERIQAGRAVEGAALAERAIRAYGIETTAERLRETLAFPKAAPSKRTHKPLPPLATIVTTHNHLAHTQACVAALRRSCGVTRIVLADDASTDGTREWAEAEGLECLHLAGGNVSANRQVAVEFLRDTQGWGGYIAFLDNDVEVPPNWWEGLSEVFQEDRNIGVLAPRKLFPSGKVQNIGNRILTNGGTRPCLLERRRVTADYVESACMAVRPEVWRSARWDARFPIFYEDADYCFQARARGFDAVATAAVTVLHHAHTTSQERAAEAERNRGLWVQKWKEQIG